MLVLDSLRKRPKERKRAVTRGEIKLETSVVLLGKAKLMWSTHLVIKLCHAFLLFIYPMREISAIGKVRAVERVRGDSRDCVAH